MTGAPSVTQLLDAAKAGDQEGWNGLVERYVPLVLSVTRGSQLSPEEVAEVSQTVWLRLVEQLDEIAEPRALPAWIITATRKAALGLLQTRNRTVSPDPLNGCGLDATADRAQLDGNLQRVARHQALREGLAELRPDHRELLLLLIADPPLSYDDISQRLDIPKGSIGPKRASALEQLRKTRALTIFVPVT